MSLWSKPSSGQPDPPLGWKCPECGRHMQNHHATADCDYNKCAWRVCMFCLLIHDPQTGRYARMESKGNPKT